MSHRTGLFMSHRTVLYMSHRTVLFNQYLFPAQSFLRYRITPQEPRFVGRLMNLVFRFSPFNALNKSPQF